MNRGLVERPSEPSKGHVHSKRVPYCSPKEISWLHDITSSQDIRQQHSVSRMISRLQDKTLGAKRQGAPPKGGEGAEQKSPPLS